jgi:purine-cytosine permease-like protein
MYAISNVDVTMVFAQAAKVFSDWWLGMIKSNPYYLTSRQAMAIYIASTLVCGVLLAVTGFISPSISKRAAKALTT